jgi:DNA-directed RNA polymerase specialized sigma24 family protein
LVNSDISWSDRGHFYAIAAQVMRRILIDHAKSRNRSKRGGEYEMVPLDAAFALGTPSSSNLLEVNDALERLSAQDARCWFLEDLPTTKRLRLWVSRRPRCIAN